MKLVTYKLATSPIKSARLGALVENNVVDLNLAYAKYLSESGTAGRPHKVAARLIPHNMIGFFQGGKIARETATMVLDFACGHLNQGDPIFGPQGEKIIYKTDEVRFLAPVPRPNSIRDTQSFEAHLKGVFKRVGREIPVTIRNALSR